MMAECSDCRGMLRGYDRQEYVALCPRHAGIAALEEAMLKIKAILEDRNVASIQVMYRVGAIVNAALADPPA